MRTGKSLAELAAEIERRATAKRDLIAPVGKIEAVPAGPGLALAVGADQFSIGPIAHGQLAEYTGVPLAYYKRMQEAAPALLASNVNTWLHQKPAGDRRMVRTLDGSVRAVLSDKYRRLDNEEVAEAVLPILLDMNLLILSCEITERRMYIKAVSRDIEREVPTGKAMGDGGHTIFDCVAPSIEIGNSEVGSGSYYVLSGVFTKACTNLATFGAQMRKYHAGARAEISDDVMALLSDETKRITDAAVWAQTRDIVRGAFEVATFEAKVAKLGEAAGQKLPDDPVQVIETLGKRYNLAEGERKGILSRLIEGASLTRYGLHAAVTRHSADVEDYDRATELERLGGTLIELAPSEWREVVKQAA